MHTMWCNARSIQCNVLVKRGGLRSVGWMNPRTVRFSYKPSFWFCCKSKQKNESNIFYSRSYRRLDWFGGKRTFAQFREKSIVYEILSSLVVSLAHMRARLTKSGSDRAFGTDWNCGRCFWKNLVHCVWKFNSDEAKIQINREIFHWKNEYKNQDFLINSH